MKITLLDLLVVSEQETQEILMKITQQDLLVLSE